MADTPFFSVIVVALNAEDLIGGTIDSILSQSCGDYEIVVKDGLSKDSTLQRIPQNDKISVYSEPDSGIYDAMNQATNYAKGKYIIYMNCGDCFASDSVLEKVKAAIGENDYAMVYGSYLRDHVEYRQPMTLTSFYLYRKPLCHQTIFFRSSVLRERDPIYDTKFTISADYNLELSLFCSGASYLYVDLPICLYLGGGASETERGLKMKNAERKTIIRNHFSRKEQKLFFVKWHMTLPRLRSWMVADARPQWLRNLYQKCVNKVNQK